MSLALLPSLCLTRLSSRHSLMQPVRRTAVRLAMEGRLIILRKGKPVDPADFRGVYRLTVPRQD